MYRFLLTPRWWGINVFVLLAIPFCIFMGSWQLGRFEDRVDSHREAERKPDADQQQAAPLDELLPVDKETSGRLATASGRYGEQFVVPGRELDGRRGSYVLTLLETDNGRMLPVVRGWMPEGAGPRPLRRARSRSREPFRPPSRRAPTACTRPAVCPPGSWA